MSGEEQAARGAPLTVLLVDADAPLLMVARMHLAREPGLEVVEAAGEQAAAALLGARPFDVLVGRLQGPRFHGSAFLAGLRASGDPRLRGLPVVLVAAAPSGELDALCRRLAPARAIAPPVTGPRLLEAVRRVAGR